MSIVILDHHYGGNTGPVTEDAEIRRRASASHMTDLRVMRDVVDPDDRIMRYRTVST